MADSTNDAETPRELPVTSQARRPVLLTLLGVIVGAETVILAGIVVVLVLDLIVTAPQSYETALAIIVLVAVAAVFLAFVTVHLLRGRPWTRSATLVWQLLQIVIAIACFQGLVAGPDVGWFLLVPAIAAIILLFAPTVVAATRRPD
jgi:hypothetical protein